MHRFAETITCTSRTSGLAEYMRLISVILFLLLPLPVQAQPAAIPANRLHQAVEDAVGTGTVPGLSATALLADGRRIDAMAGLADPRDDIAVGNRTRFLSGSVGKTVTALLAVQLAEAGTLDLDAPVSTWLSDRPWWPDLANADALTLRMLLNHSAGVPDYLEDLDFFLAGLTRGARGYAPDELVGFVAGDAAEGEPGAHFSYSDTDYILVGLIIETATGEDFYSLARREVIEPLGMDRTEPLRGRAFDDLAAGHRRGLFGLSATARNGELKQNLDHEWTGGGWVTTPGDLATLYRSLGDGGHFAEEGAIMRAGLNAFDETGTRGYGLGLYVRLYENGHYRISHGGDFGGYRSAAIHDSRTGITLAVQGNAKDFEAPDFAFTVMETLTAE